MIKNVLFKMALAAIPVAGLLLLNSFSLGAPAGRTGSPGDMGLLCTNCHAPGANFNASVSITTTIPPEGYALGQTYQVIVSVNPGATAAAYGFQVTAENSGNIKIGTWAVTDGTAELAGVGGNHVTHSTPDFLGTWTVNWTAPNTDQGAVTFYAALNAVNFNGTNSGDQVATTQLSQNVLGLDDFNSAELKLYPNPAVEELYITIPSSVVAADAVVYTYLGKEIMQATIDKEHNMLDVNALQSGFYIVAISANGKLTTKSFVKQ